MSTTIRDSCTRNDEMSKTRRLLYKDEGMSTTRRLL